MATKFNPTFLKNHLNIIIEKLSFGKFYKLNAKLEDIEDTSKNIFCIIDNDGQTCFLKVPKDIIGNEHDEDEFVENLIKHAH